MNKPTNLQYYRTSQGYTQKQLADLSEVSIRMIQGYEQGTKDINKASGITLKRLAFILECTIEDLLEL